MSHKDSPVATCTPTVPVSTTLYLGGIHGWLSIHSCTSLGGVERFVDIVTCGFFVVQSSPTTLLTRTAMVNIQDILQVFQGSGIGNMEDNLTSADPLSYTTNDEG